MADAGLLTMDQVRVVLGCLERWGFVTIDGSPSRAGFGSGRGIKAGSAVTVTAHGAAAQSLWPEVVADVDERWRRRFSLQLATVLDGAGIVAGASSYDLPHGVASGWLRSNGRPATGSTSPATSIGPTLARALGAIQLAHDERSPVPLELAANVLRILDDDGVPLGRLPTLTGISRELTVQTKLLEHLGLVQLRTDGGKRLARTPAGVAAQRAHGVVLDDVEAQLAGDVAGALCSAATTILSSEAIADALRPPDGTRRSGVAAPALGRADQSATAARRTRDLVAQTELFLADPIGALPHFPMWDGNRGFGP